ncbi:MAG: sigma-70 family RNA polymerase sigma factor [Acidimicrobiales bacterium]
MLVPWAPIAASSDDSALVAAAQSGDRAALEALLARHHDRLYAVCRRLTSNDADAQDACQETMILLVKNLARFDGRSAFSTWAYRVATNASLDELRRRRRRPVPTDFDHLEPTSPLAAERGKRSDGGATDSGDPGESVGMRLDLEAALAGLPADQRSAVVLRDVAGLSYAEIAEAQGVAVGTVRSRIARGRQALIGLLDPDWNFGSRAGRRT